MTRAGSTSWAQNSAQGTAWSIERPEQARASMAFFPDQRGGVYEKLLAELPVMLHSMDGSGRFLSVNAAWCQAFGYEPKDVIGRTFSELLTMDSRSRLVTEIYPKFLVTSRYTGGELFMHRKDGSLTKVRLSMTAYRGERGRLEQSVCVLEEIGEQAAVNGSKAEQQFKAAFAAAANGLALVSTAGRIEMANAALADLLQRDDLATKGEAFENLIVAADRAAFITGMRGLLSGQVAVLRQEMCLIARDAREKLCAVSVALIRNEAGEPEQLLIEISDQTERKAAQAQLHRAQKMEAIGQLTGGIAHDFNNLLTIIIGNLELVDPMKPMDERSARRIAEAADAAQRGSALTRQLLAIARKQDLAPADVKVNGLLQQVAPLLSRSLGEAVDLKVSLMAGDPVTVIDASQLESALLNLAINSRDAMPQGGKLTIETQGVELDADYAAKHSDVKPGPYVMIAVTDTGGGMPTDIAEKAFQPFFSTKPEGMRSGLGLSMVYGFIKQSGGHVTIYSEPGHGTSVKMYLPRKVMAGESMTAKPVAPINFVKRKKRILVVEDQEAVRAVACGFLQDFGYDIVEAGDGFQALAVLQEQPGIDLMFSDVVMPGGMNGFDLAQAAQQLRPDLRVVHTSGYPKGAMAHQDEPRFKDGRIIMKPYRREELQKMIKDALDT